MGSAEIQGELWGAKADDWATIQEPAWQPVYAELFSRAGVARGTNLLDVGCGAGGALLIARDLGADIAGLDASQNLVALARARLPGARIERGEMEELPFANGTFDLVTGFNTFQFASNTERALSESRRVAKPQGKVAMLVWGRRQDCELLSGTLSAVMTLLPPPSGTVSSLAFSEPGVIETVMRKAALSPVLDGEIDCQFHYPDAATAWRAISSAGIIVRAIRQLGETAIRTAVTDTFSGFTRADKSIIYHNRFRWVIAEPQR
jgi:SAM-dependent methyltransferase